MRLVLLKLGQARPAQAQESSQGEDSGQTQIFSRDKLGSFQRSSAKNSGHEPPPCPPPSRRPASWISPATFCRDGGGVGEGVGLTHFLDLAHEHSPEEEIE